MSLEFFMNIPLYKEATSQFTRKSVPDLFLPEKINEHLIWEVITMGNANLRQGTHKVKTRAEVRGGGRKPWRQKGTGFARAGSRNSPIWRGGGVVFGPTPRSYRQKMSSKKKKVSYMHIIAKKVQDKRIVIFDDLNLDKISSAIAFKKISKMVELSPFSKEYTLNRKLRPNTNDRRRNITIVVHEDHHTLKKSLGNIPWVSLLNVNRLIARKLHYNHGLFFTEKAFDMASKTLENS